MTDPLRRRAARRRAVPAVHITGPTNPAVYLCQEWSMRAWEFDDIARVQFAADVPLAPDYPRVYTLSTGIIDAPFLYGAVALGLEDAIRAIRRCLWWSPDDFTSPDIIDCRACLEVARS